jgi:2'-5' RNA ligase
LTRLRRAFLAIVPPRPVLDAVERVLAPLRAVAPPRMSWTGPRQWHLTLQFLGTVTEERDDLSDALRATLRRERPLTIALGGAGAFPSPARASVLWIGVEEGQEELAWLANAVARATEPFGYTPDRDAYTAHLTVARARSPRRLQQLVEALGDGPVGPRWDATAVVLMESDTRPQGAVYREVDVFGLGGARR